jgi:hypothetical protein
MLGTAGNVGLQLKPHSDLGGAETSPAIPCIPSTVTSVHERYFAGDRSTIPAGGRGTLGCSTRHSPKGIARLMSIRSLLGSLHRYGLPSFIRCLVSEVHGP